MSELIQDLLQEDYFGFEESAIDYVYDLIDDIVYNIESKYKKFAPEYFSKYGKNMYSAFCRRNKNTTWYISMMFTTYTI